MSDQKNQMVIVGIDQGLKCPGIAAINFGWIGAIPNPSDVSVLLLDTSSYEPPHLMSEEQTYHSIAMWAARFAITALPAFVAIEQPTAAHANASLISSAGCVGAVRMKLYENQLPTFLIQPTHMKKAFTGNARAQKPEIIKECKERFGKNIFVHLTKDQREARADAIGVAVTAFLDHWALPGKERPR